MDLCDGFFTQKVAGVTIYTIKPKIRTRNLFIRNVDKGKIDPEVKENPTKQARKGFRPLSAM